MNIGIIGTGYVGLVTGVCFADLGNSVICVDIDKKKIEHLKKGIVPIYEPGLEDLVKRNSQEGRLKFSTSIKEAVRNSLVIFIAVSTPPRENGEADLSYVENVSKKIAESMTEYRLIVEKSTVPVETGKWVEHTIKLYNKKRVKFDVASNPEFLREGSAISDFMHPDRIVIGIESKKAKELLCGLYKPLNAPIVITNIKSAELIKHASNSFLATKISFINSISNICELVGADIAKVAEGMGLDRRIGRDFLNAGIGFGGFCLPKDLDAFITITKKMGYEFDLLKEVKRINEAQKEIIIKKIEDNLWITRHKIIGILGLSFKPNTDDMRYAPSIYVIRSLKKSGARIKVFDPKAMNKAREILNGVKFCKDAYDAARQADCLVVITEWNEFKELDFARIKRIMRVPIIIDARNIYEPDKLKSLGFRYIGIGRS